MSAAARDRGELAILLHSHMPYVEGFGTWPFGEEWLFEAIATSYLPLLELCERWAERGEEQLLTIGVTPVLADQLVLGEVGARFLRFVRDVRAKTHALDIDGLQRAGERDAAAALRRSAKLYERAADHFEEIGGDLVGSLRRLRDAGAVELWTSAATHAVLPMLATEAGTRLQVETGIESQRARFGGWSGGFWLPECAYRPGMEDQLARSGVRCYCVYSDGGSDEPLGPVAAGGHGPVAVPIDWPVISLVWDEHGYPADGVYRDYHRPTLNGLRAHSNAGGPYDAERASAKARDHARDFVERVAARLEAYRSARGRPGLVVCALDTELLGHWWHEGPQWLEAVIEEAGVAELSLCTLPEALGRHDPRPGALAESSWGAGKDLRTWDSEAVAGLVWPARRAELGLAGEVARNGMPSPVARDNGAGSARKTALERAARELLALQASDWAFMATRRLAADYPEQRVSGHEAAFGRALAAAEAGVKDCRLVSGTSEGEAMDGRLRGLAPGLRLSRLAAPPSAWGRPGADAAGARARCAS